MSLCLHGSRPFRGPSGPLGEDRQCGASESAPLHRRHSTGAPPREVSHPLWRDEDAGGTHDFLEGHGFVLGVDDGALDEELVLALSIDGEVLLHGLEHDWTAGCFMRSCGSRIGMDATYLRPRQSHWAPPCQSWALHSKAVEGEDVSLLSATEKLEEIGRADLGVGRLDQVESNGRVIIARDLTRTLYRLGERAWMQEF